MDSRLIGEVSIMDLFDQFIEASTMRNVLSIHHRILNYADLNPCEFNVFFPKLKRAVLSNKERKNWKAKALFSKIDKKAAHRCYSNTKTATLSGNKTSDMQASQEYLDDNSISSQSGRSSNIHTNNALQHYSCLVIGSGPAGLRTAIELQLLGASRVVIVEKRSRFSRNNVLHLWPFVIDDLKSLGAKKFYGKFCAGSIDHISIRQLQLILLKICLMIGCDFRDSCSYLYLCPESLRQTKPAATIEVDCDNQKPSLISSDSSKSEFQSQIKCNLLESPESAAAFVRCDSTELALSDNSDKPVPVDMMGGLDSSKTSELRDQLNQSNSSQSAQRIVVDEREKKGYNLHGARAHFQSEYGLQEKELHSHEWDFIIGADGRRNTLSKFFPRKEFRGRLAIAITANFINRQTPTEAAVPEISGLSFIYNQDMFNALAYDTNIQLENICYYKDDTHYFVMTAKKKSLLERGVLLQDYATTQDLLSDSNVNKEALLKYAKEAAFWTTGLEPLDFALNHYGQEDCAMFDFTSMYAASNACKALRTNEGGLTLVNLVGDSLLEPFWPTGSGCARGFLSSFDAAWMCRQWAVNRCAVIDYHGSISSRSSRNRALNSHENGKTVGGEKSTFNRMALSVMAERESIYRILAQTKSENLQQNYSLWTLNPHTRYPNLNRHLVTPGQCEHLITDFDVKVDLNKLPTPNGQRTWRVKSPNNNAASHRKSPKKLKSANASPLMEPKNRSRAKSLSKAHNSNYRSRRTMPSSNNLLSLEARRARDIDDCLRQRRQKSQIGAVKDHLMLQMRKNSLNQQEDSDGGAKRPPMIRGNAVLFTELRRLREQQSSGKENIKRDAAAAGPLTILNSMRRCASFAERVKSFESKLGSTSGQESTVTTPRTPTDNVKNLPEFATLQELFVKSTRDSQDRDGPKKSKMPIMKLSKDDWNVKCWEKRLASYKQRTSAKELSSSTRSLNKSVSVDGCYRADRFMRCEKQVEVFKDRIKEMAEKLEKSKEQSKRSVGSAAATVVKPQRSLDVQSQSSNGRARSWVNHLKQELIRGAETSRRPQQAPRPAMNPSLPSKPIKKLFADDDDNDDGIDVNKHYDHLCVNRPSNRLFSKNNYTSHLRRTKFDSSTSRVINVKPTAESKQAYLSAITPRTSSASSTLSDYSTNTGGSSSGCGSNGRQAKQQVVSFCARCKTNVPSMDRIRIGDAILHKTCLTCAECGITLRTNELQYYLDTLDQNNDDDDSNSSRSSSFVCAICKPILRANISKAASSSTDKAAQSEALRDVAASQERMFQQRMKSRAEFFNERVNYNELYKNIFTRENRDDMEKAKSSARAIGSEKQLPPSGCLSVTTNSESPGASGQDEKTTEPPVVDESMMRAITSPSPISITLPLQLVLDKTEEQIDDGSKEKERPVSSKGYRIARSETIDGSEQVTLVLPAERDPKESADASYECREPGQQEMVDEDELNKMLHLQISSGNEKSTSNAERGEGSGSSDEASDEERESNVGNGDGGHDNADNDIELSDDPSSLNSPPNTEDYDNEDDGDDDDDDDIEPTNRNSTYDDFLTSEEFGASSDKEPDEDEDNSNDNLVESSNKQESQNSVQVSSG